MKSTLGYRRPSDCIIRDSEWAVASYISNQSFLDIQFYDEDILQYTPELGLLGVIVGLKENYELLLGIAIPERVSPQVMPKVS
jgi:sacsin